MQKYIISNAPDSQVAPSTLTAISGGRSGSSGANGTEHIGRSTRGEWRESNTASAPGSPSAAVCVICSVVACRYTSGTFDRFSMRTAAGTYRFEYMQMYSYKLLQKCPKTCYRSGNRLHMSIYSPVIINYEY